MMGDNRDDSRDSRYFGAVLHRAMIGRPMFIYWSYESGPYPQDGSVGQWAEVLRVDRDAFFHANTLDQQTGTVLR